jgi:hypothetical protein
LSSHLDLWEFIKGEEGVGVDSAEDPVEAVVDQEQEEVAEMNLHREEAGVAVEEEQGEEGGVVVLEEEREAGEEEVGEEEAVRLLGTSSFLIVNNQKINKFL